MEKILKEKNFGQLTLYSIEINSIKLDYLEKIINPQERNFVLIIDEINRGNIPSIFGELITIIEEDKRIGQENELQVKLPYSGDRIGIPSNLHIIGTMNTADRSIALMDVALRKRFNFIEYTPDESVIEDFFKEKGIWDNDKEFCEAVIDTFETLNKRIWLLLDKDHKIGHSYFLNIDPENLEESLLNIWYEKLIPLLKEYFYNDWDKLRMVLGEYKNKNFIKN